MSYLIPFTQLGYKYLGERIMVIVLNTVISHTTIIIDMFNANHSYAPVFL